MNHVPINLREIPKLYEQQSSKKKFIYAKFYIEGSDWSWSVLEYSKLQHLLYCYIEPEQEFSYITIDELSKTSLEYDVEIELKNYAIPKELQI